MTFPLWCVISVSKGGLGWESAEVGEALASIGCDLVIFQLFFYEWMIKTYFNIGAVETFFRLLVFSATFLTLLPLVSDITLHVLSATDHHLHTRTNVFLWLAVIGCALLYRIPATAAFSTLTIVVNASIDPSMRGTMNGLIMTAGSIGNGTGPVIGSTVYALALAIAYSGNSQTTIRVAH